MQTRTRRYRPRHRRQHPLRSGLATGAALAAAASAIAAPAVVDAFDSADVSDVSASFSTGLSETTLSSMPGRDARVSRSSVREAAPAKVARKVVIKEKPKPKPQPQPEPAPTAVLPMTGYDITSQFGDVSSLWSSGSHTGLDFAAPSGTAIRAIKGGTVTEAGWDGAYGYKTVVQLPDGSELWYCHQNTINVSVGQQVGTGDVIGTVGATGNVTGPHLHLEYRTGADTPSDPAAAMASWGVSPY